MSPSKTMKICENSHTCFRDLSALKCKFHGLQNESLKPKGGRIQKVWREIRNPEMK